MSRRLWQILNTQLLADLMVVHQQLIDHYYDARYLLLV
jgi:hypothetical protein